VPSPAHHRTPHREEDWLSAGHHYRDHRCPAWGVPRQQLFGVQPPDTFFDLSTWLTAIIGAVVLFFVVGAVRGRRSWRA